MVKISGGQLSEQMVDWLKERGTCIRKGKHVDSGIVYMSKAAPEIQ